MSYDPSGLYLVRINETRNPSPIPYFVNAPNATTSTEVVEKSFEQEFSKAAEQYSGYFLLAAAATQTDTIAIGPADAAAAILVIALVVKCTSVALNNVSVPAITIPKLEAPAISIPKAEEKEEILPNLPPNNKTTYYHATTYSNALSIIESGTMKGSIWEGGYIYAWRCLPSNKAVYNSGAKMGVIISFETSASFVLDNGVSGLENLRYLPVVSLIPGPISVENVKIVRRT